MVNKKCDNDFVWHVSNCECEYAKKAAKLTAEEKCEEINDSTKINNEFKSSKTILIKEKHFVEDCKPFVASSILFSLVVIILNGLLIYFYVNSKLKNYLSY